MVPRCRVLSEDKALSRGCDDHLMDLDTACQFSSSKGSNPVNGNWKVSFLYVVEASFTATGLDLDDKLDLVAKCTRLHSFAAAARQQVKLSSRTLCPILLRQILQNHHGIDARTPLKPRPRACGFLTHDCQCLVCSAFWASAEPAPRWRLLASYSTDFDDLGRYRYAPRATQATFRAPWSWQGAVALSVC